MARTSFEWVEAPPKRGRFRPFLLMTLLAAGVFAYMGLGYLGYYFGSIADQAEISPGTHEPAAGKSLTAALDPVAPASPTPGTAPPPAQAPTEPSAEKPVVAAAPPLATAKVEPPPSPAKVEPTIINARGPLPSKETPPASPKEDGVDRAARQPERKTAAVPEPDEAETSRSRTDRPGSRLPDRPRNENRRGWVEEDRKRAARLATEEDLFPFPPRGASDERSYRSLREGVVRDYLYE